MYCITCIHMGGCVVCVCLCVCVFVGCCLATKVFNRQIASYQRGVGDHGVD